MSRYQIGGDPEIVVGWDHPLRSFFLHHYGRDGELVWEEGAGYAELCSLELLERGNAIDALIPSVPTDSSQCLIARNLNFNCQVDRSAPNRGWSMTLTVKMGLDGPAREITVQPLKLPTPAPVEKPVETPA